MYEITEKRPLAESIWLMSVKAPDIARSRKPGQFVILKIDEEGERFPLTIVDSDLDAGTVTVIVQAIGGTTKQLAAMEVGESIQTVVGPLGNPTHLEKVGHVVCIGGGVGIAPAYPITKGFKGAGNRITAIISARTADLLILEDAMRAVSDELLIATDDGTKGIKGFPTAILQERIDSGEQIDLVLAVGPVPLMAAVSTLTRKAGIPTVVSLNPIMVDGTGMCGGCRVTVGGETKFACVDGPEFDGHAVDFDQLTKRLNAYTSLEKHHA